MARTSDAEQDPGDNSRAWSSLLALRPAVALIVVWLTTAGHTASFREMGAARGWITSQGYALHSIYLLAISITLVAAPHVAGKLGSYASVLAGLTLLAVGSLINGLLLHADESVLCFSRALAGIGSGLVIYAAPRILRPGHENQVVWAGIVLPASGPIVIAYATQSYGWSSWGGAFLFEALMAVLALGLMLSISHPLDKDRMQEGGSNPPRMPAYLPLAIVSALAVWHVMHWGQLYGWLEDPSIVAALVVISVTLSVILWMVWPQWDPMLVLEGLPRLGLIVYGGFVQYFNSSDMGVYGGLLLNFSPVMRAWLIWSLPVGSAAALAAGRVLWPTRSPGYGGAALGLGVLAGGMALSHWNTLNWPFWSVLNTVEFNWFAAPQHWQLAPARFLMGFGSGMVLLSMTTRASTDPVREAKIRPFLQVAQFTGGALSIGALATALLVLHQLEYSYVADRGYIQSVEQDARRTQLAESLAPSGEAQSLRKADVLLFRAVNYEADNLVFADIYGGFLVASLTLAVPCAVFALTRYIRAPA